MMRTQFMLGFVSGIFVFGSAFFILYKNCKRKIMMHEQNHNHDVHAIENTTDFSYYYQLYPEKKILYLSPSTEYFFGKGSIEYAYLHPDAPFRITHPDDYHTLIKKLKDDIDFTKSIIQRWKDKKGKYRWFEEYATPIYENGRLIAIKGVLRNIDEKIKLQTELQFRLNHDSLTGIYNRVLFEQKMVEFNEQSNIPIAIILCDLDELKYINDHFGHKEGDQLIKSAAVLLNKFSSETVTVARIGGDEFVLIVANMEENEVQKLVNDIVIEMDHYNRKHLSENIKMSIGYSYSLTSIGQMEEVFTSADQNMYIEKMDRKNIQIETF